MTQDHKEHPEKTTTWQDAERAVRRKLESAWIMARFPNIEIHHIGDDIVASGVKDRVEVFDLVKNGEVETIFNLHDIRNDHFFNQAARLAGFREVRNGDKFRLYHLRDIDGSSGVPLPQSEPIRELSLEYFHAWLHIDFMSDKLAIEAWKKKNMRGNYTPLDEELIDTFIHSWTIRLRDMRIFLANGQISNVLFLEKHQQVRNLLSAQINDDRFENIRDSITQSELDKYFVDKDMDERLHEMLSKQLKEKRALTQKKLDAQRWTKEKSYQERKSLR